MAELVLYILNLLWVHMSMDCSTYILARNAVNFVLAQKSHAELYLSNKVSRIGRHKQISAKPVRPKKVHLRMAVATRPPGLLMQSRS